MPPAKEKIKHRLTKERKTILEYIRTNQVHPTADTIWGAVRKTCHRISFGTVYRNLNFLVERGYIKELMIDKITHYDGLVEAHVHLICQGCGGIFDVHDNMLAKKIKQLAGRRNFQMRADDFQIRGYCRQCQQRKVTTEEYCPACGTVTKILPKEKNQCHSCGYQIDCYYYQPEQQ